MRASPNTFDHLTVVISYCCSYETSHKGTPYGHAQQTSCPKSDLEHVHCIKDACHISARLAAYQGSLKSLAWSRQASTGNYLAGVIGSMGITGHKHLHPVVLSLERQTCITSKNKLGTVVGAIHDLLILIGYSKDAVSSTYCSRLSILDGTVHPVHLVYNTCTNRLHRMTFLSWNFIMIAQHLTTTLLRDTYCVVPFDVRSWMDCTWRTLEHLLPNPAC